MTAIAGNEEGIDPFAGFVLGMAVGDAIGLPREGMSPRRASRIYGGAPLRHRLVLGCGMVSDDTEHMRMTAMALLSDSLVPEKFGKILAWKLRWWLLGLPAGVGLATAKSIIRLWLGWKPDFSGVYSAGNGPAMRSGVLGLCLHRDGDPLRDFVRTSTRMTHTDPRAETGAMLIALAVRVAAQSKGQAIDATSFLKSCREQLDFDTEWLDALGRAEAALRENDSGIQFSERMEWHRGVSGYIVHTVVAVLFCWLRWPGEFRRPLEEIVLLGGDADTTAAILGGLAGASCGVTEVPQEWLDHLIEWPYSVKWMRRSLSRRLREKWGNLGLTRDPVEQVKTWRPLPSWIAPAAQLGRNTIFLTIVMAHGIRRLLPPY